MIGSSRARCPCHWVTAHPRRLEATAPALLTGKMRVPLGTAPACGGMGAVAPGCALAQLERGGGC